MTDNELHALLRELANEPLPMDSLVRVRLTVERRTARTNRWNRRWLALLTSAAGVVVACLIWTMIPPPPREPVPPPAPLAPRESALVTQPAVQPSARPLPPPPARRAMPPPRTKATVREAFLNPLIRIETPDPDVVILLVGDGDREE